MYSLYIVVIIEVILEIIFFNSNISYLSSSLSKPFKCSPIAPLHTADLLFKLGPKHASLGYNPESNPLYA